MLAYARCIVGLVATSRDQRVPRRDCSLMRAQPVDGLARETGSVAVAVVKPDDVVVGIAGACACGRSVGCEEPLWCSDVLPDG